MTVHTGQQSSRSVFNAGLPTIAYHDAKPDDAHRTIRQHGSRRRCQTLLDSRSRLVVASQERCKSSDVDSAHLQF